MIVSIHAPARGATLERERLAIMKEFQSTHPHGVRHATLVQINAAQMFQSTHPHGVRQKRHLSTLPNRCFNPRTRTGCDENGWFFDKESVQVSIHAPARGATFSAIIAAECLSVSIHAPARGAT